MYEDFPDFAKLITNSADTGVLLCGRRGSGKTSNIIYNKERFESKGIFVFIFIQLDKRSITSRESKDQLINSLIAEVDRLTQKYVEKSGIDTDTEIIERFKFYWKGIAGNCYPDAKDSQKDSLKNEK